MKVPPRLQPLIEEGLVDDVLSQLMSGKEAAVFVVLRQGVPCCAKVYKEAERRSFRQAALYVEGRQTKNSRQARAMQKKTQYGRQAMEEAWRNVEADTLYRLWNAKVRVPEPYGSFEGVLLMELVLDAAGDVAPRLNDVELTEAQAHQYHGVMIEEIRKMLIAGVIHGDLSEYNVLLAADGPVLIDLPQAVNASANNNAKAMLLRDVDNMKRYFSRFAPGLGATKFGLEMWAWYERGLLSSHTQLTGHYEPRRLAADVDAVLKEIAAVEREKEAADEARRNREG